MDSLQQVFRLNNEGANLLCSPDVKATMPALRNLNEAIVVASRAQVNQVCMDNNDVSKPSEMEGETGIWDLCMYSTVTIPIPADTKSFYFFDQAICLRPEIFADHMACNGPKTLEFFSAMTLMNTALCFYRLANACLAQRQGDKADRFFRKSLQLYSSVINLLTRAAYARDKNSKAIFFFLLAAQNNYLSLSLQFGMQQEAMAALKSMMPLLEGGCSALPQDAIPIVEEIMLNTMTFAMTDAFTKLPAAAA